MTEFKLTNPDNPPMEPEVLMRRIQALLNEAQMSRLLPPCVVIVGRAEKPCLVQNFESKGYLLAMLGSAVYLAAAEVQPDLCVTEPKGDP